MAFPALAVAGAGLFGGLGFFGANAANDAIEANALAQQNAINDNIENLRLNFFDTSRIAAKQGQRRTGQLENRLFDNFASGYSLNRVIAAEFSDQRKDQAARKFALERNVANLETQKRNIAAQASSQTQSPLLAAVQGGIQGAQLGASLQSGFDSLSAASEQADFMSGLEASLSVEGPPDPNALAQLRAFQSGVPVSLIQSGGAIGQAVLQPFRTQIQTEAFQASAFDNAFRFQQAQTQAAQQQLFYQQQQFNAFSQSLFGSANFNPTFNPLFSYGSR